MTPLRLQEISGNGKKLYLKKPLILQIYQAKSGLLIAKEPNLSLHVFAYTHRLLIKEVNEQVIMMWDEYVKESLESLTLDAQHLREQLLLYLEEP